MVMGSLLSHIFNNISMEYIEINYIHNLDKKTYYLVEYINDVCYLAIQFRWSKYFLDHINNKDQSIKFTLEIVNDMLPFLHILN